MKEKLDNKNIGLAKTLYHLKENADLFKILTVNAENIKQKGRGKTFFSHVHRLALESFVVNICKIFELEKDYELDSIYGILNYIKNSNIIPKNTDLINKFVEKYGNSKELNQDYATALHNTCKYFYKNNIDSLQRYDDARSKKMVHAESGIEIRSLPCYADMERFMIFGIDFYSMISNAYTGFFPHEIEKESRLFSSTSFVLEKYGLENIKKDFEN